MIIKIKKINYEIKFHPGGIKYIEISRNFISKKEYGWDTDGQKSKVSSG